MRVSLGIDLGISRGAIGAVKVKVDRNSNWFQVVGLKDVARWDLTKKVRSSNLKLVVFEHSTNCIPTLKDFNSGSRVGIDWTTREVFMRGNQVTVMNKAFLAGVYDTYIKSFGMFPFYYGGTEVRKFYKVKPRSSKEDVWSSFADHLSPTLNSVFKRANEHLKDAWCLALITALPEYHPQLRK